MTTKTRLSTGSPAHSVQADSVPLTGAAGRLLRLRSNGRYSRAIAVQLLVPAALLALVYVGSVVSASVYPYSLAEEARANGSIVVVGPFVALAAAFEMRVLRALWGRLDIRRPWYRVAVGRLWVVATAGLLVTAAAYVSAVGPLSLLSSGWGYPLLSVVGVLVWVCVGAALGLMFRPVAAVPLAVVTPYLALTLPGAWEPFWLRHLSGLLFDCCTTSELLDSRAVVASLAILTACGVVACMAIFLRLGPPRPSPAPLAAGTALAIGLVIVGIGQARDVGMTPTVARSTDELRCSDDVCLWPEDGAARRANELAWSRVGAAWTALGLRLPATTVGPVSRPGVLGLVALTPDSHAALASMSLALPRAAFGCEDRYEDERVNRAADGLAFLVLQRAGIRDAPGGVPPVGSAPSAADVPELREALGRC